jgi:hypothetical protein
VSGSAIRDFATFLGYCIAGYLALSAANWVLDQLPTWAVLAALIIAGAVVVARFGPDRDAEFRLDPDGHITSSLFEMGRRDR